MLINFTILFDSSILTAASLSELRANEDFVAIVVLFLLYSYEKLVLLQLSLSCVLQNMVESMKASAASSFIQSVIKFQTCTAIYLFETKAIKRRNYCCTLLK